jgi:NTP pyrophosphatase (non-canonical NTP hydrolase)
VSAKIRSRGGIARSGRKSPTLDELMQRVLRFRDARDWKQFHDPKDLALTLVLETAEVLEHMQWRNGRELREHLKKKHNEVSHELADVLHVLLLLAEDMGVDLAAAFAEKMRVNEKKYPVHKARGSAKKYTEL